MRRFALLLFVLGSLPGCSVFASTDDCDGETVTISGTEDDDTLKGTSERDVIAGGEGDDRIEGLGGDDVLCGGPGEDRIDGGPGDDRVFGGQDSRVAEDTEYYVWHGDILDGGPGNDLVDAGTSKDHEPVDTLTFASATKGVEVDLGAERATGEGEDVLRGPFAVIRGSGAGDAIVGTERDEEIFGMGGPDVLDGREGDDRLWAGNGQKDEPDDNVLVGGRGDDELSGSDGDDELRGGQGKDNLYAGGGADVSLGGPGDDALSDGLVPEGAGRQQLDGGEGTNQVTGLYLLGPDGSSDVEARGATGEIDLASGLLEGRWRVGAAWFSLTQTMPGFSRLTTPKGTWTVWGTDESDEIIADDEKHGIVVHARAGDDNLAGTFEDDLLDGGPGRDTASPYVGKDTLVSIEKVNR